MKPSVKKSMNPADDLPTSAQSQRDQQALQWFVRLRDTPVPKATQLEFDNWCAAHPKNARSYQKIAAFWQSPAFTQAVLRDEKRLSPARFARKRRYFPALAMAASVLLVTGLFFYSGFVQRLTADSYTTVGEQREVVFADGSSALLDTDTAIAVDYNAQTRVVKLLSGRAFFQVRHNSQQPFIVLTEQESVRVVGTRFSVETASDLPLQVQQGIVKYENKRGEQLTVTAGKQVSTATDTPKVLNTERPQEAFTWTQGRLVFRNQRLADVIAQVDRYQPGIIVINNSDLANRRVTGNYKLNAPLQIVDSLAQITGASVSQLSGYLTILN